MLAPLKQTLRNLHDKFSGPLPTPLFSLDVLFEGEAAAAVVMLGKLPKPQPVLQVILRPREPVKAREVLDKWLARAQQMGILQKAEGSADATQFRLANKTGMAYSVKDGVILLTVYPANSSGQIHQQTLARMRGPGGLGQDPLYMTVRRRLGAKPEAWFYWGAFSWLNRNAAGLPMVGQVLASMGLQRVRGCVLGCTIEDRGFRTRLFIHMPREAGGPKPAPPITEADLALVPRDVVAFSMGHVDLTGLYDVATRLLMLVPPPAGPQIAEGISKVEAALGMSIRNDLLALFGNKYLTFVTAPGSPAGRRRALFLAVSDRKKASENLAKLLNVAVGLIRKHTGEEVDNWVKIRTIDRGAFTQIYAQSVLPGMITPNLTVTDRWASLGFSAGSVLAGTRLLLNHKSSVSRNESFTRLMAKMPKGYHSVSYTDVPRSFGSALKSVQFLTDLGVIGLKVFAKSGKSPIPINAGEFWAMDPGRFPDEALIREKLFGGVSVWVRQEDGVLYENFSSVGPLPMPTRDFGGGAQTQVAQVAILAGMLLPALARARMEGRHAVSKSNLRQVGMALMTYHMDHGDNYPDSLADLWPKYLNQPKLLVAPNDGRPFTIKKGLKCSYRYIGNVPFRDARPDQIVAYEHRPIRGRRNVLHYDSHVKSYVEAQFRTKLARQYQRYKKLMAQPNFPGNRERAKAFFELRRYPDSPKPRRMPAKGAPK